MMLTDKQTMQVLHKVLVRIKSDPSARAEYVRYSFLDELSYHRLGCAVGNHAFDDSFEKFGITKSEGEHVRSFFHNTLWQVGKKSVCEHHIKVWLGEENPTLWDRICGRKAI